MRSADTRTCTPNCKHCHQYSFQKWILIHATLECITQLLSLPPQPPPLLVFLERVQSQVADANLGARSLNALFGVLNPIPVVSLEIALLGDGSGAPCLLSMDIVIVGVRSKPKRAEIAAMISWARSMAQDTIAARLLPPTMHGIPTIDLLAAVFLYTAETPYPLYSCLTVPLNVTGVRTLQSLLHQLPFMKLFSLGLRCLPKCAPYLFQGALYRVQYVYGA